MCKKFDKSHVFREDLIHNVVIWLEIEDMVNKNIDEKKIVATHHIADED